MSLAMEKQATFKEIQKEYDHLFKTDPIRDETRAYQWFAKKAIKANSQPELALDLACGGGYFLTALRELSSKKTSCVGIDLSPQALQIARKECPTAALFEGMAENLPFQKDIFDIVACLGSLEHFLDTGLALHEMVRVTRKRGRILILVPNIFWYKDLLAVLWTGGRLKRNQTHEKFASLAEWEEILEGSGLEVSKVEKYNGIAKNPFKQWLKDRLIPLRFSYHFLFICQPRKEN